VRTQPCSFLLFSGDRIFQNLCWDSPFNGFLSCGGFISVPFLIVVRGIQTARTGYPSSHITSLLGNLLSAPSSGRSRKLHPQTTPGAWLNASPFSSTLSRTPPWSCWHHHDPAHFPQDLLLPPSGEHSHVHMHQKRIDNHPHRPDNRHMPLPQEAETARRNKIAYPWIVPGTATRFSRMLTAIVVMVTRKR
jgi:hypothetical protein